MENEEVFYPNKLTPEEIENLEGWKLKVATVHFGVKRGDCVRFGYGYALKKSPFDGNDDIYLVADDSGPMINPVNLRDEIDWKNPMDYLRECGINSWHGIAKNHILEQWKEWFEEE